MGPKLSFPEMKSLWAKKAERDTGNGEIGAPISGVQSEMAVIRPSKEVEEAAG